MTKRRYKRNGPRSARQQGEDIGNAMGEIVRLLWELVTMPIKWVWRKVKR